MPVPIKFVNRGASGLLNKLPQDGEKKVDVPLDRAAAPKDNIQCDGQIVDIDSIFPDPMNARLHPDRNMQAIIDSLCLHGQKIPLVVREQNRVIAAGNGRHEAMKILGWTKVAISIRPMTDLEFHSFALADNRTAELARWHTETIAKVDALIQELSGGQRLPGFTMDELEVLRAANWTPPAIDNSFGKNGESGSISFKAGQYGPVGKAIERYRILTDDPKRDSADCLSKICENWLLVMDIQNRQTADELFGE